MTFTPIPNGVRIVHLGTIGTLQVVNTIGCVNGDGEVGDSMENLAKNHGDAWRAHIVPVLLSAYTHDATLAYSLSDQSLAPGDAGYSASVAGGISGDKLLPLQVCMVTAFKTAKRGRTYAGRSYLSGMGNGALNADGRTFTAGTLAAMQSVWAAYKGAVDPNVSGDNGAMAVCSKGSPEHGIPPHVEKVTAIVCRAQVGTQRRRLQ